MSLHLKVGRNIPEETRKIAQAAFPKGNVYLWMGDELGDLYSDSLFIDLYPVRGQPSLSPGRLALVTVMQFMEGLTDRQAAEAVRGRIDWKYALGLELADPGFDFSVLSEFRQRLLEGQKEQALLDVLLDELKNRKWIKERSKQRTDSTHVIASVRQLNRLEMVGETMRRALNELAAADPEWLGRIAPVEWFQRYGPRMDGIRLPKEREQQRGVNGRDWCRWHPSAVGPVGDAWKAGTQVTSWCGNPTANLGATILDGISGRGGDISGPSAYGRQPTTGG